MDGVTTAVVSAYKTKAVGGAVAAGLLCPPIFVIAGAAALLYGAGTAIMAIENRRYPTTPKAR